jgi:thiol-disulfide isomerase/thioredoxin
MRISDSLDRRAVVAGVAATLACPTGLAATSAPMSAPRLFADTPLTGNRVAMGFEKVDIPLPAVRLAGEHGKISLDRLIGKARIVTLWAEWCAPCLVEARDFAVLQRRFAGPSFEIVAVLTASAENLGYGSAVTRLKGARVEGLPVLVEPDGGKRLMMGLSPGPDGRGGSLPCNLIVDPHGRIRGRSRGTSIAMPFQSASGKLPEAHFLSDDDKRAMLAGDQVTLWRSPAGDALVTALRDGILDRI